MGAGTWEDKPPRKLHGARNGESRPWERAPFLPNRCLSLHVRSGWATFAKRELMGDHKRTQVSDREGSCSDAAQQHRSGRGDHCSKEVGRVRYGRERVHAPWLPDLQRAEICPVAEFVMAR